MTPEQEEQVRRALAAVADSEDGGASPTMPPEVVVRLDGVLADLVQGRSAGAPEVTRIDELAVRRHRRWPTVLVAAAAVAVIAVAGGVVANHGLDGATSDTAASGSTGSTAEEAAPQAGAAQPTPQKPGDARSRGLAALPEPRLRSTSLAIDLQRLTDTGTAGSPDGFAGDGSASADRAACARPEVPRGADVVDVRLDGKPATLVLAAPVGGTREARVYSCDDGSSPVATGTVRQR